MSETWEVYWREMVGVVEGFFSYTGLDEDKAKRLFEELRARPATEVSHARLTKNHGTLVESF